MYISLPMDELEPIILLVLGGIFIRFSLTFRPSLKSHAQTVTFMLLPEQLMLLPRLFLEILHYL